MAYYRDHDYKSKLSNNLILHNQIDICRHNFRSFQMEFLHLSKDFLHIHECKGSTAHSYIRYNKKSIGIHSFLEFL